jgi:group I intron endonuclease
MEQSGIYVWTCTPTGKQYVGSALNIFNRKAFHLFQLRKKIHHSFIFQRVWDVHGEAAFRFEVLLICAPADLIFYEQRAMDVLKPELNIKMVAGSNLGYQHTEESKKKLSESSRKERTTSEGRARVSAQAKRQWADPKIRAKMLEASSKPETVAKKSASMKERWNNPEYKEKVAKTMNERRDDINRSLKEAANRPEVKAYRLANLNTPQAKAKSAIGLKKAWEDPENRKRWSDAQKAAWVRRKIREGKNDDNNS